MLLFAVITDAVALQHSTRIMPRINIFPSGSSALSRHAGRREAQIIVEENVWFQIEVLDGKETETSRMGIWHGKRRDENP